MVQRRFYVLAVAVAVIALLGLAATAEAARWKTGPSPRNSAGVKLFKEQVGVKVSGSAVIGEGVCHYNTAETSTYNQCRWKRNNGCFFTYGDSGDNQCTGADNTATLTVPNGTVTFTSLDDGDGRVDTKYGLVTATYNKTGDQVVMWVRVLVGPQTATAPGKITLLGSGRMSHQPTPNKVIRTDAKYPWVVERGSVIKNGVKVPAWGYKPPETYFLLGDPLPPAPPPGSYTCGVAYSNFLQEQANCYRDWGGGAIEDAFSGAMYAGWKVGPTCVGLGYKAGSLAVFGTCMGITMGTQFGQQMLENLFMGSYGAGNTPDTYNSMACNSIAKARYETYAHCQPFIPPGVQ